MLLLLLLLSVVCHLLLLCLFVLLLFVWLAVVAVAVVAGAFAVVALFSGFGCSNYLPLLASMFLNTIVIVAVAVDAVTVVVCC